MVLSKKLKQMLIGHIVSFIAIEGLIIFAYVYALINLPFSVFTILIYIVALIVSVFYFVIRLTKINRYLYGKKLKVKHLKRPMDLPPLPEFMSGLVVNRGAALSYYLIKQDDNGKWMYHDILEAVDQYQQFEMIKHNQKYALIKDSFGHYYVTYLDDLEIDNSHV